MQTRILFPFFEKLEGEKDEKVMLKKVYIIQHNENPRIFVGVFESKEAAMIALMSLDLTMGDKARNLYKNREELLREYSILEAEIYEEITIEPSLL